ncbi:MAG: hypothetical protein AAGF20_00355 [Pseudomonadota bacterium]
MVRPSIIKTVFGAGEVKRALFQREDLQVVVSGLQRALNGMPIPEGGMAERPGTIDVGVCNVPSFASKLIEFVRASNDRRLIELSQVNAIVRDPDTFQTLATYAHTLPADRLHHYRHLQLVDAVLLFDRQGLSPVRVLKRDANEVWSTETFEFENGPFYRLEDGVTLTITAVSGIITVTADQPVFKPGHVGALLRLFHVSGGAPFDAWTADKRLAEGSAQGFLRYNNGRVYEAVSVSFGADWVTGLNPPVHDDGIVTDGRINWRFVDDGAGYGVIETYLNTTQVSVRVKENLPQMTSTSYWCFGGFSEEIGYPSGGLLFEERLWVYAPPSRVNALEASRTNDWSATRANYKPGTGTGIQLETDAVSRQIAGGQIHPIAWAVAHGVIIVATTRNELRFAGSADFQPVTPADAQARERGYRGAAAGIDPIKKEGSIVYVARGTRDVRAMDVRENAYSVSIGVASSHLFKSPIVELADAEEPDRLTLARHANGGLTALVYDPENDQRGWTPWLLGGDGVCTGMASMPGGGAVPDRIWLVVKRGSEHRIEAVTRRYRADWDDRADAIQVDGAARYDGLNRDLNLTVSVVAGSAGDSVSFAFVSGAFVQADIGRTLMVEIEPASGLAAGRWAAATIVSVSENVSASEPTGTVQVALLDEIDASQAGVTHRWAFGVTQLSGLDRFNGQAVDVLVDGFDVGPATITGGIYSLDAPAARVCLGHGYSLCGETFAVDYGASMGSGRTGSARIAHGALTFDGSDTLTLYDPTRDDTLYPLERLVGPSNGGILAGPGPLLTDAVSFTLPSQFTRDARIGFKGSGPLPKTITGLAFVVESHA